MSSSMLKRARLARACLISWGYNGLALALSVGGVLTGNYFRNVSV